MSWLQRVDVTVWRNEQEYKQSFEFGKSITPLSGSRLPGDQKGRTGTRVKFLPDKQGQSLVAVWTVSRPTSRIYHDFTFCLLPPRPKCWIVLCFVVFTSTTEFDYSTISGRVRELAFLNPQVIIHWSLYVLQPRHEIWKFRFVSWNNSCLGFTLLEAPFTLNSYMSGFWLIIEGLVIIWFESIV